MRKFTGKTSEIHKFKRLVTLALRETAVSNMRKIEALIEHLMEKGVITEDDRRQIGLGLVAMTYGIVSENNCQRLQEE